MPDPTAQIAALEAQLAALKAATAPSATPLAEASLPPVDVTPTIDPREAAIDAKLALLDEKLRALQVLSADIAQQQAAAGMPATSQTPKFSQALEALVAEYRQNPDRVKLAFGSIEALRAVYPRVAAAAEVNSNYRGKKIAHSLAVGLRYLESRAND